MEYLKKNWILPAIILAIAVISVATYFYVKSVGKVSYEFVEAKKTNIQKLISETGQVKSENVVNLAFEQTGKVAAINVKVGDRVKAGQPLAVLDQTDYSDQVNQSVANLEIAKAGLVQSQANLKKEKKHRDELVNTHASKYTVDVQRAQVKSAEALVNIQNAEIVASQAALRSARDQHQKIVLISPIEGVVSEKNIEVGEVAGPNAEVIAVIDENNFKVEALISQADISDIKAGDEALMTFDTCADGESIDTKIASIDPAETEDKGNSAYRASFEVGKISDCVKPGATANVKIVAAEKNDVLSVPVASLLKRGDGYFVLTQDEKGIHENKVQIGIFGTDGNVEIISGITEGEQVIKF
jgi:HlyD family secretion protein